MLRIVCFCLVLLLLFPLPATAGVGDLMVAPTRILLEGRTRAATINLVNRGNETATYRVSLYNQRMDENGNYTEIKTPEEGEHFADSMLRFSPRQVVLKPGEGQTVRVMATKPAGLAEGEYRSHLLFRALPPENAGETLEQNNVAEGGISVKLIPVYGVSIPVVVRQGKLHAGAQLSGLALHSDKPEASYVSVVLERSGNASLYGDVDVVYTAPGGKGGERVLGELHGVSVLAPYPHRHVRLDITLPEGVRLEHGGTLRVRFRNSPEETQPTNAEQSVKLP